jgi:hypothetical protein
VQVWDQDGGMLGLTVPRLSSRQYGGVAASLIELAWANHFIDCIESARCRTFKSFLKNLWKSKYSGKINPLSLFENVW